MCAIGVLLYLYDIIVFIISDVLSSGCVDNLFHKLALSPELLLLFLYDILGLFSLDPLVVLIAADFSLKFSDSLLGLPLLGLVLLFLLLVFLGVSVWRGLQDPLVIIHVLIV